MSSYLAICGVEIPVLEGSWQETRTFIGVRGRGGDGSFRSVGLGEASAWSFETTWLSQQQANGLRALITGSGLSWDFEDATHPVYSSTGVALWNVPASIIVSGGRTGTKAVAPDDETGAPFYSRQGYTLRFGASVGVSAYYPSTGVWHDWWLALGPGGTTQYAWKDGVASSHAVANAEINVTMTISDFSLGGNGGTLKYDDVIVLFGETDVTYAQAFHARAVAGKPVPYLPRVPASGLLLGNETEEVLVRGVVETVDTATLALDGVGLTQAVRLKVTLNQVLPDR